MSFQLTRVTSVTVTLETAYWSGLQRRLSFIARVDAQETGFHRELRKVRFDMERGSEAMPERGYVNSPLGEFIRPLEVSSSRKGCFVNII